MSKYAIMSITIKEFRRKYMKKFDLSVYKSSKPYFDLLDVYIKEQGIRKESFLIEIGVTPSSYRKEHLK